jgi:hypothetical protein
VDSDRSEEIAHEVADRLEEVIAAEEFLLSPVEDARRSDRGGSNCRRRGDVGGFSRSPQATDEEEARGHCCQNQEEPDDDREAAIAIRSEDQVVVGVIDLEAIDDGIPEVGELLLHRHQVHPRHRHGVLLRVSLTQVVEGLPLPTVLEEDASLSCLSGSLEELDHTVCQLEVVGLWFEQHLIDEDAVVGHDQQPIRIPILAVRPLAPHREIGVHGQNLAVDHTVGGESGERGLDVASPTAHVEV